MKGNKKILVVALLLLLISVTFTTYAIYKTAASGNAEVTAAIWDVEFKDGTTTLSSTYTLTFSGTDCSNTHVAEGKIAPGATCTKTITLDAGSSEVDVAYTASAATANITATKGGNPVSTDGANAFSVNLTPANDTITYSAGTRTKDISVEIVWAGTDDSDTDSVNGADTALNGATISVPITLVAKQVIPGS